MNAAITSTEPSGPADTASHLLDVAERLFAEHGIEAVSIRRIVRESGQGNLSAAHYHFGTREALTRRLLERRMQVVDKMRHERLDRLLAQTTQPGIHALLGASIATLIDVVRLFPWGGDYVQVIAQALFNPRMRLLESIDPRAISGLTRMVALAREALADLPADVFDARMTMVQHETVYAIARWLHAHGSAKAWREDDLDGLAALLTDFMSAGLSAPASPDRRDRHRSKRAA
jgi:AcrR family transcriptional regulator